MFLLLHGEQGDVPVIRNAFLKAQCFGALAFEPSADLQSCQKGFFQMQDIALFVQKPGMVHRAETLKLRAGPLPTQRDAPVSAIGCKLLLLFLQQF